MKQKKQPMKQAVALSYNTDMTAPTIVASGYGKVAEHIIETGKKNDVPVYEDQKMATILTKLEVGDQIPEELYEAIAKILLFVKDMDELYGKTK